MGSPGSPPSRRLSPSSGSRCGGPRSPRRCLYRWPGGVSSGPAEKRELAALRRRWKADPQGRSWLKHLLRERGQALTSRGGASLTQKLKREVPRERRQRGEELLWALGEDDRDRAEGWDDEYLWSGSKRGRSAPGGCSRSIFPPKRHLAWSPCGDRWGRARCSRGGGPHRPRPAAGARDGAPAVGARRGRGPSPGGDAPLVVHEPDGAPVPAVPEREASRRAAPPAQREKARRRRGKTPSIRSPSWRSSPRRARAAGRWPARSGRRAAERALPLPGSLQRLRGRQGSVRPLPWPMEVAGAGVGSFKRGPSRRITGWGGWIRSRRIPHPGQDGSSSSSAAGASEPSDTSGGAGSQGRP